MISNRSAFLIVVVCLFSLSAAQNCRCPTESLSAKFARNKFILAGRLVQRFVQYEPNDGTYIYFNFQLRTIHKASVPLTCPQTVWLKTFAPGVACSQELQVGQDYLVTGDYHKNPTGHDDIVYINGCGYFVPLAQAQADPVVQSALAAYPAICGPSIV
eukprot:GILJ01012449.1.p1 GENE.GILJ01012449.1~~GILJ01012449.1.p1  ORF type:complete len:158 (+),score=9.02 GILJ01012449.1:178-651(+)